MLKPRNIDGLFLAKILLKDTINKHFQKLANGITRFGIAKETIQKAKIPLPPLPEQHRIASILSQIDEAIEKEKNFKNLNRYKKERSNKARAEELKYAIVEHIEKHFEEDPEFYERFSDLLKRIIEEYRDNWDALVIELEKLREAMKKGREAEKPLVLTQRRRCLFSDC